MSFSFSNCDTPTIPAKRPASSDIEPYRISRSMTAEDPDQRSLLIDNPELPTITSSTKRRVNPESLAVRLGPELVAELERFVQPGVVEMPSFAVRQEIQTRFNVDRRHIYDWFHSKGLRVTREDKRATVELKADAMRLQRRRRCVVPVLPAERVRPRPMKAESVTHLPTISLPDPPAVPTVTQVPKSLAQPPPQTSTPVSYVVRYLPPTSCVSTRPPPGTSRTFKDPHIDAVFPHLGDTILNQTQRQLCYETLARVLGPADGIQECVGTYSSYMAKQTETYYERLASMTRTFAHESECSPSLGTVPANISLDTDACSFSHLSSETTSLRRRNSSDSDSSLGLDDILASSVLEEIAPIPRALPASQKYFAHKNVSFAPKYMSLHNLSSVLLASGKGSSSDRSSSSLAGALGDLPAFPQSGSEQEARRKSREWVRPPMGRARAYSGAGVM